MKAHRAEDRMENKVKVVVGILIVALATLLVASKSQSASSDELKKIVLTKDNTIILNDEISGESVGEVIKKAKELDNEGSLLTKVGVKKKDPIYVFLRSPGGEIQTGLEMLEMLKGLNRPVDTITMFSASMAFQTVQQLGKRYIVKNGVLMSHRAAGEFSGSFGGEKPSQMDSRKGLWESRMDEMDKQTVDRTNGKQTLASYQKAYASELWLTGSQAVDQGYADEVANVQCSKSLSGTTTKSINLMGFIQVDYDLDNCPLNSTPMNVRISGIFTTKGKKNLDTFLEEGGGFGSACLMAAGLDPNKVCAIDTNLTLEKVYQIKDQFKSYYENIQNRIVPYGL